MQKMNEHTLEAIRDHEHAFPHDVEEKDFKGIIAKQKAFFNK